MQAAAHFNCVQAGAVCILATQNQLKAVHVPYITDMATFYFSVAGVQLLIEGNFGATLPSAIDKIIT